ncbi:MAG: DUF1667 domain-containing protein [Sphaerochaetaceae bacterium]
MSKKELTCIGCPLGCSLTVDFDDERHEVISVTGNSCPTGDKYARKETTNPTRIVTSSIPVIGGTMAMVSVKTRTDVPKSQIFAIMKEIHQTKIKAPVHIGDVLVHDCAHTKVDIVATRNVDAAR